MGRKLFCEYGAIPYEISVTKEAIRKDIEDRLVHKYKISTKKSKENFEYIWKSDAKLLFRKLHGVDMQLQINKAKNLELAGNKIDGILCQEKYFPYGIWSEEQVKEKGT